LGLFSVMHVGLLKPRSMAKKKQDPEQKNHLDQSALAAIFDLYSRPIFRYALRLCEDPLEADQIVGDVFNQFLEQVSRGGGPKTNLRSYLYQIAYHIFIDHARERQRIVPLDNVDRSREGDSVDSQVEEQNLLKELSSAIQNDLTEEQKHVIILRFQEELSLQETANILGKDINAIKSLQTRAILKLQKSMGSKP
jgi:RNA polymerase sigma-70 factor (ECF subfamily)